MQRLMLINWKWDVLEEFILKPGPGQSDQWEKYKEGFATMKGYPVANQPADIVFPINLNISHNPDFQAQAQLIVELIETVDQAFPDHHQLFFFHEKHGFYTESTSQGLTQLDRTRQRHEIFGGGMGKIYNRKGLLSHNGGGFYKSYKGKAATWDEAGNVINIQKKHFDFVWDHYWYGTAARFELLRRHYNDAVLFGGELIEETLELMRNFLAVYEGVSADQVPAIRLSPIQFDFRYCDDLRNSVYREEYLRFAPDLIRELREIVAGTKPFDLPKMPERMDLQIELWKK